MIIEIDQDSGFCFGVVSAIKRAEEELERHQRLYCLGDIVHNSEEVNRLTKKGLHVISHEEFKHLQNAKVLFRAHGEPPAIYRLAAENRIEVIDATCPIVLRLQKKIAEGYKEMNACKGQILIYGKKGHAEVIGLEGQTENTALVISSPDDLSNVDYEHPIRLYAQTTMSRDGYDEIIREIKKNMRTKDFIAFDTLCQKVSNRVAQLQDFSKRYDVIIFVSGKNSSNGQYLYHLCKQTNPWTCFISTPEELRLDMWLNSKSIGICGATSTPMWLMEAVRAKIKEMSDEA